MTKHTSFSVLNIKSGSYKFWALDIYQAEIRCDHIWEAKQPKLGTVMEVSEMIIEKFLHFSTQFRQVSMTKSTQEAAYMQTWDVCV